MFRLTARQLLGGPPSRTGLLAERARQGDGPTRSPFGSRFGVEARFSPKRCARNASVSRMQHGAAALTERATAHIWGAM